MSFQNKIVIIVSSGNSGGGALHDYLLSRKDFVSPIHGEEFRLIADPHGIENLYNQFNDNFSLYNCSEAFYQFKKYSSNLSNLKIPKTNRPTYGHNFNQLTSDYLNKIEAISWKGLPQFKRISLNIFENLFYKLRIKFLRYKKHEHNLYKLRLPQDEKFFLKETNRYLMNIFKSNVNSYKNKNLILDQATNFWKPEIVIKYFKDPKILIVTRDPRSVFYSMKFRSSIAYPGYDIKIFVKWYKYAMNKRSKIIEKYKKNILEVKFEKFVNNIGPEIKKINNFLKIKNIPATNFDYEFTKNNVYKAKKGLTRYELNFIKKNLKDFLQW